MAVALVMSGPLKRVMYILYMYANTLSIMLQEPNFEPGCASGKIPCGNRFIEQRNEYAARRFHGVCKQAQRPRQLLCYGSR